MNEEVYEILKEYQNKPGMYFGRKSLSKLVDSLYGYMLCMNRRDKTQVEFFLGFQNFIEREYEVHNNLHVFRHWSEIISFFAQNEEEAFDEFFIKIEDFLRLSLEEKTEIINYCKPI